MVYTVGLTGTIASGKSTVGEMFSSLGMEVFSADKVSKVLTAKEGTAYKEIVGHYGSTILLEDGTLNRKKMRAIIFSNEQERKWLEHLLHPLIREQLALQVSECKTAYCIVEIPLLIDKKAYPYLNRILVITAPVELQIARIMKRDNCTAEEALSIIAAHPEDKVRLKNADDVLVNDKSLTELKHAVEQLHTQYLKKASE